MVELVKKGAIILIWFVVYVDGYNWVDNENMCEIIFYFYCFLWQSRENAQVVFMTIISYL